MSPGVLRIACFAVALGVLVEVFVPYQALRDRWLADPTIEVYRNIEYEHVGDKKLTLDLARPRGVEQPAPAMVFIHGGGWRFDGNAFHDEVMQAARRGYVGIRITYRLLEVQPDGKARYPFPAQMEDVYSALQWVQEHAAEYRIDAKRIGLVGVSAGGQLALLAGLASPPGANAGSHVAGVRAVVNLYGPTDLLAGYRRRQEGRMLLKVLLNGTPEQVPQQYYAASPVNFVSKDDPPVLTIHGAEDTTVPIDQALRLDAEMKQQGGRHTLIVLEGESHGLSHRADERASRLMYEFMEKHLGRRSAAPDAIDKTLTMGPQDG